MRARKSLLLVFIIVASIVSVHLQTGNSATTPIVGVDPAITHVNVGGKLFVNLTITDVVRLYSWQVNITFNPSVLRFVNITEGDFLKTGAPEGTWTVAPLYNNTKGYALFGWALQGNYIGPSGSGWLGSVELSVVGEGESVLNITNTLTKLIEYRPPPPPPGETVMKVIHHARQNGFFTNLVTPPHTEFTYSPLVPGVGTDITFNASASHAFDPQVINRLEWDFGDEVIQVLVKDVNLTYTTTHRYAEAGIYDVFLTVFDNASATPLVESVFGTSGMPRLWYELFSSYEATITLGLDHDVAVIDVKTSKSEVAAGESVTVDVKVLNKGTSTESFTVEAYYGSTLIGETPVSNLISGANQSLQFTWNTSGVPAGVYTIKAVAADVAGEAYAVDNTKLDGTVEVTVSDGGLPIMLIAGVAVVIIVVIVAAIFLLRRRKST